MLRFRRQRISHTLADTDLLTVILEWDESTRQWMTLVPRLNNISTFGATQKEALDRTCEMIYVWLEGMRDLRKPTGLTASHRRRLLSLLEDHADGLVSMRRLKEPDRIPMEEVIPLPLTRPRKGSGR